MILDILPLSAAAARLVRVYGQDPCVVLPGRRCRAPRREAAGPITELGDYCFSEKPRSLPASDAESAAMQVDEYRCSRKADRGPSGRTVGGSANRRYDFDFGDAAGGGPRTTCTPCAAALWKR